MSLRRVLIVVLILSALAILIFSIRFNGKLRDALCSEIVIEIRNEKPYSFVSKRAVMEAIEKAGLQVVGQRIEDIKLDKIRSVIEKNPYILSARCYVSKANRMYIDIEERQPMFRVVNFENYFVDNRRVMLENPIAIPTYLPVVSGAVTKTFAQNELFDFVAYIQDDEFLSKLIQQIYVSQNLNIELITALGNQVIKVGRIDKNSGFEARLRRLKSFYLSKTLNHIGWDKYTAIDLRFDKQIVCKR
jgi:cell division protein